MENSPSVRRALVWSFAERYTSLLVTIASTMILARILTPAQIGIFSLCAAVTAVAGILRDFGVSEYLIQEKQLTECKMRAAFAIAILVAWTIAAVVLLGRNIIANYYGEPGIAEVLAVLSLNFFILPFASPAFALLNREMAFRKIFAVQTTSSVAHAITAIGLAMNGYSYLSLAWATVANSAIQAVLIGFMRPKETLLMPSLREAKAVFSYGSMFVTSRIIETFTRNAHEFIIAKQFGFASVGQFSRALGLIELFYTNVTTAILRVATPAFAANHRAGLSHVETYSKGTAIFTSISWPFFCFVALMSYEIIHLLFGPQWDAAVPIAMILSFSMIPSNLVALAPNILSATGHVKTRLKITLFTSPVHLSFIFLASFLSVEAIATAWGLSNMILTSLYILNLSRIFGTTIIQLLRPCFLSAFIALVTITTQALVLNLSRSIEMPPIINILLVAISGAIAWYTTLRITKHPTHVELHNIWQRMF